MPTAKKGVGDELVAEGEKVRFLWGAGLSKLLSLKKIDL